MILTEKKVKVNEQRLEKGLIRFIDHANTVIDTTIVILGNYR